MAVVREKEAAIVDRIDGDAGAAGHGATAAGGDAHVLDACAGALRGLFKSIVPRLSIAYLNLHLAARASPARASAIAHGLKGGQRDLQGCGIVRGTIGRDAVGVEVPGFDVDGTAHGVKLPADWVAAPIGATKVPDCSAALGTGAGLPEEESSGAAAAVAGAAGCVDRAFDQVR